MKQTFKNWCVAILILGSGTAAFGASEQELRQFLYNVGFVDIVAQIKQSQQNEGSISEMTRRQQEQNKKMYETVNASRELALFLYQKAQSNPDQKGQIYLFADFTAKMLSLEKMPPSINIPKQILDLPEGDARSKALNDWLTQNRRVVMEEHARRLVTDMTTVAYGKEIPDEAALRKMYTLTTKILNRMYQDPLIGETKYFGRALLALSAYRAHETGDRSGLDFIKKRLSDNGKHIENFLGDTWLIDSKQGPEPVHIENGSMVMTRNLAPESLEIGFGAIPAKPIFQRAKAQGTFANLLSAPFFVSPEDLTKGVTWTQKLKNAISQSDAFFNTGFSHIGYVALHEDEKTGIKMSWTYDNYPHHIADIVDSESSPGGVRFGGLEQMVNRLSHSKILVGSYDHEKFHRYVQGSSYPENGVIFESLKTVMKDGKLVADTTAPKAPWTTDISRDDFRAQNSESDADVWYRNVSAKFSKEIHNFVVKGIFFQWVTPLGIYVEGGAYCSQTGVLAWGKSTGINIEEHASRWNPVVVRLAKAGDIAEKLGEKNIFPNLMKKFVESDGIKSARTLVPMTIIAPSSLVAQTYVNTQTIPFQTYSFSERAKAGYSDYKVYDQRERQILEADLNKHYYESKHLDPIEKASASLFDIEYSYVMRALKGNQTAGIDVLDVAQDAADLGLNRLMKHEEHELALQQVQDQRQQQAQQSQPMMSGRNKCSIVYFL